MNRTNIHNKSQFLLVHRVLTQKENEQIIMCVCCVALPCGVHSLIFVLLVWYTELLFTLCVGGWKMYESCSSSRCKYYSLYLWSIYIRSVGACTLSIHMHMSGKSSTSPKLYENTHGCVLVLFELGQIY